MESWKQVEGCPHLFVSNTGKVWTTVHKRYLKPHLTNRGYLRVNLYKNGKLKQVSLHRIVAEAFIPNPKGLTDVDHINDNKLDNRVENLQWMSRSDNLRKANNPRCEGGKPVICIETGKIYKSLTQASRELKIPVATISAIARGEYGSYRKLHFEYYNGGTVMENNKHRTGAVRTMADYVNAKEYAEIKGVPYEAVKSRVRYNLIPHVRVGRSTLIDRNTPWEDVKKGRPEKSDSKADKSKFHIVIKRGYYIAVCDKYEKTYVSCFSFSDKVEAERKGKEMKEDMEKKFPS